jgi:hypothetical protein
VAANAGTDVRNPQQLLSMFQVGLKSSDVLSKP